jgi:hypothetical protein
MENWDATHDDEKIEKLSQIIQLISTRIKASGSFKDIQFS